MDGRDLGNAMGNMLSAGCGLIIFLSLALVALLGVLAYLLATR